MTTFFQLRNIFLWLPESLPLPGVDESVRKALVLALLLDLLVEADPDLPHHDLLLDPRPLGQVVSEAEVVATLFVGIVEARSVHRLDLDLEVILGVVLNGRGGWEVVLLGSVDDETLRSSQLPGDLSVGGFGLVSSGHLGSIEQGPLGLLVEVGGHVDDLPVVADDDVVGDGHVVVDVGSALVEDLGLLGGVNGEDVREDLLKSSELSVGCSRTCVGFAL